MKPRIPSWSVSSAPAETSHTRRSSTGRSRSISASATRQPTAERLSLAPGTTRLRHMSPSTAALAAPRPTAAFAGPRRPVTAAAMPAIGPARAPHHCGGWVLMFGITSGKRSWNAATAVWSNMKPVCAASWCASTTSVREAPGSPRRPTTLTVCRSLRRARRRTRGPFWISSTNPASASAERSPPSLRRPPSVSAAPAAPRALRPVVFGGKVPHDGSTSRSTSATPAARSRSASHSAASRSPGEHGGRSIPARCSITSRSVSSRGAGIVSFGLSAVVDRSRTLPTGRSRHQPAERPATTRRAGGPGRSGWDWGQASTGSAAGASEWLISVWALLSRPRISTRVANTPRTAIPAPTMKASA